MKKLHQLLTKATLVLTLSILSAIMLSAAGKPMTVRADGYHQGEAKKVLKMMNKLRKPGNAWCYNESGGKDAPRNLRPLKWDKDLEQVAKIRARELVGNFAHDNFNHYPQKFGFKGENIAEGQRTAKEVFVAWCETKESYAGQGHRRNMLSKDYSYVGIACYESGGKKYWVQNFGAIGAKQNQGTTNGKVSKNKNSGNNVTGNLNNLTNAGGNSGGLLNNILGGGGLFGGDSNSGTNTTNNNSSGGGLLGGLLGGLF